MSTVEREFLKKIANHYGFNVYYEAVGGHYDDANLTYLVIKSPGEVFYWNEIRHTFEDFFDKLADYFGERL